MVSVRRRKDSEEFNRLYAWVQRRWCETSKGIKFDDGKIMVDLLVPEFIEALAKVMTMGVKKYGIENWKNNLEKRRILAALYRHLLAYHKGEILDAESGLSHLCHVAVNAMFLFWYDEIQNKKEVKT